MPDISIHPVDWFNLNAVFKDIFRHDEKVHMKSDREACFMDPTDLSTQNATTYKLTPHGTVEVLRDNPHGIASGSIISKFTLLTAIRFKGDYRAAESYVMYKLMELEVPYVRIGTNYYKRVAKEDRWGGESFELKDWNKDTITEDHTKTILKLIPKYDSFCLAPDNVNFNPVHKNRYNLYLPFPHQPHQSQVTPDMIPHSMQVMKHIFGSNNKLEEGFIYMKCLYEYPRQMLPIVVLLSEENKTGKTTFLDWIYMIFGDNSAFVNPESITSEFNSSYATKNILMFEEAFFAKQEANEKIKRLTTGKIIQVRNLYQSAFSMPLFCKLIMCSNKVYDFMRLDKKETRYFILEIKPVTGKINTKIDECLFKEIPLFLRYLQQQPPIDFTQDRLVLTQKQTETTHLSVIKEESRSQAYKEILLHVNDFFDNNSDVTEFHAAAIDIKKRWFERDNQIKASYLFKVIKQEIGLQPEKMMRYYPFDIRDVGGDRVGTPFKFVRNTQAMPCKLPDPFTSENGLQTQSIDI